MAGGARLACAAAGASLMLLAAVAYRHSRRRGALLAQAPLLARPPPRAAAEPALGRSESGWGLMRAKRRLVLLSNLRDMAGTLGLDIGGTMSKMVLAVAGESQQHVVLGGGFREHPRLSFSVELDPARGSRLTLQFVATSTDRLAEAVRLLQSRVPQVSPPARHKSLRKHWGAALEQPETSLGLRPIVTAGGGAHKYGELFEETLGVRLVPFRELAALVEGLHFLRHYGPSDELFSVDPHTGAATTVPWPSDLFPFLVVNIGSGASILQVDSEGGGDAAFRRVGGTACGGATFLGLCRALTGEKDFATLIAMADKGDETHVDTSVGDIYGPGGCSSLGMPEQMTAANFGKLAGAAVMPPKEDLVCAALTMVVQASVLVSKAHAATLGASASRRIFFVGGFLQNNAIARRLIAQAMESLGGRALFARHADFLGALGSLSESLHRQESEPSRESIACMDSRA